MLRLVVLYWTVQTMMRPLVAPYAYTLDAGTALAGAALAASAVPAAVMCIPIGLYCDRLGYRLVVIVGALVSTAGAAVMAAFPVPAALLASQVLFGAGQMAIWVAIQGLMITSGSDEESRTTRAKRVINYTSLGFIGQVAGPLVGGYVVDLWGYATAFVIAAGLSALCLVGVLSVGRGREDASAARRPVTAREVAASYVTAFGMLRDRGVNATMAVSFCGLFLLDVRLGLHPVYFHSIGISASMIGWVLVIGTVSSLVSRSLLILVVGKLRDGTLLGLTMGLAGLTVCGVVLTESLPVILVLSGLGGAAMGIVQPLTILLAADHSPPDSKGLGIGLRMLANRGAQTANPVLFGALTPLVGLAPAIGAIGLVGGAAGLLAGRSLNRVPPPDG